MLVHLICGARPNIMKIAPLYHAMKADPDFEVLLVDAGQHYDDDLYKSNWSDFELPPPNFELAVGRHDPNPLYQMSVFLKGYEQIFSLENTELSRKPGLVIVAGDVNSTLAGALAAAKLCLPVAHLEAGLRSYDRTMPEEVNRVLIDSIATKLWAPDEGAIRNLYKEGIFHGEFVGNIMIDALIMKSREIGTTLDFQGITEGTYCVLTIHRPFNTTPARLQSILVEVNSIAEREGIKFILPAHPRTKSVIDVMANDNSLVFKNIIVTPPLPYTKFMNLVYNSIYVVTDSGGIQEETSYLGIPCFTLRGNTERPITLWPTGTNTLCTVSNLDAKIEEWYILHGTRREPRTFERWDGMTASRCVNSCKEMLES